jgi:hypothetical protein
VSVRLSEIAVIKAMLDSLIATEEKSLEEIIRNHQFHSMEARRFEMRMIEANNARNQWKTLLKGLS